LRDRRPLSFRRRLLYEAIGIADPDSWQRRQWTPRAIFLVGVALLIVLLASLFVSGSG
jgi:hypothetical protein